MDARLRGKLSRQDFKDIVFSDNFNVHIRFRENFNAEIENCIDACAQVYDRYKDLEKKARSNKRSATVLYFSYGALNNLVISLRLLVSGYLASSGNLMRGFAEATAMMLLCSHPSINTLNQFWKNPNQFSMHNALDLAFVRKKCDKEAGRAGFKHGFLRPRIPEIDKELPNACGKGIETSIQRESTNSIVSAWGSGPMTPGEQKSNKRRSTTGRRWLRGPSRILSLISFFLLVDEYCKKIVPPG